MSMWRTGGLAIVLMFAACGGDKKDGDKGGKVASCMMVTAGSCREYRGGNLAAGLDNLKKLCEETGVGDAKFAETACPTEKLTGTCKKAEGKDYFYEGSMATEDVEKYCNGTQGEFAKP
jgi:hypothetical protein